MPEPIDRHLVDLSLVVNDQPVALRIEPRETIADVLRERVGLTGLKVSCDAQVCGACTVLVDGLAVSGCTYLAVDADGRSVATMGGDGGLIWLSATTVAWLLAGIVTFRLGEGIAKRQGTLSRY